jgi:hypothetical protein
MVMKAGWLAEPGLGKFHSRIEGEGIAVPGIMLLSEQKNVKPNKKSHQMLRGSRSDVRQFRGRTFILDYCYILRHRWSARASRSVALGDRIQFRLEVEPDGPGYGVWNGQL